MAGFAELHAQPMARRSGGSDRLRAGVERWLASHPAVPWSVEFMLRRVEQVGQAKAAVEALKAGGALRGDLV